MKILACSDLHGDFNLLFDKNYQRELEIDAIVCAGDVTNYGLHSPKAQAEFYNAAENLTAPFYWVPGNHDISMHSDLLRTPMKLPNGLVILGASMSPCFSAPALATQWHNMTASSEVDRVYYETLPPCDILVSHCPPISKTGYDLDTKTQLGSPGLLEYIKEVRPIMVICGHVHNPAKRTEFIGQTLVTNVACTHRVYEF